MRFFETIRIEDGRAHNLFYHNLRLNKTIYDHFGFNPQIDLKNLIDPPTKGLFRCKVVYSDKIESIHYYPYTPKKIATLKIIEANIDYAYKYLDRSAIELLLTQKDSADDILIVKNGLITDTSIANVAFYRQGTWYTPKKPLLPGTTRQRLLDQGVLQEAPITIDELVSFEKMALLNAMIGFFEMKLSIIW